MTPEKLKELVCKELSTWPTKSKLHEDFDLAWDSYIELNPLKAEDLTPLSLSRGVGGFNLMDKTTKKELIEKAEKLPDNSYLFFDVYEDICTVNAYEDFIESEEEVARRFITKLYTWSQMTSFPIEKKLYLLKKENEMLKKQLDDLKS